jgi:hypothetical protein
MDESVRMVGCARKDGFPSVGDFADKRNGMSISEKKIYTNHLSI